jgi:ribosomal protein S14
MNERQKEETKRRKKEARRESEKSKHTVTCSSCKAEGHSSVRSPLCGNHKPSKEEEVCQLLGAFTSVTRKIKLSTILREGYRAQSQTRLLIYVKIFVI